MNVIGWTAGEFLLDCGWFWLVNLVLAQWWLNLYLVGVRFGIFVSNLRTWTESHSWVFPCYYHKRACPPGYEHQLPREQPPHLSGLTKSMDSSCSCSCLLLVGCCPEKLFSKRWLGSRPLLTCDAAILNVTSAAAEEADVVWTVCTMFPARPGRTSRSSGQNPVSLCWRETGRHGLPVRSSGVWLASIRPVSSERVRPIFIV